MEKNWKKNKGFTLIELLAVIVILAIIMVIAIPKILDVIESSKQKAAISGALGYIEAVNNYQAFAGVEKYTPLEANNYNVSSSTTIDGKNYSSINSLVSVKGHLPTAGSITIGSSKKVTSAVICMEGYKISCQGKKATILASDCNDMASTTLTAAEFSYSNAEYPTNSKGEPIDNVEKALDDLFERISD